MTADPAAAGAPAGPGARGHIRLTSHNAGMHAPPIHWGAATAAERGPVVGTTTNRAQRNVIGTHVGSYGVYRALAVAAGALSREHKADLTNTAPTDVVGPYPQWADPATDRLPGSVRRRRGRRVRRRTGAPATTSGRPSR